jgi:hypothetical protein
MKPGHAHTEHSREKLRTPPSIPHPITSWGSLRFHSMTIILSFQSMDYSHLDSGNMLYNLERSTL